MNWRYHSGSLIYYAYVLVQLDKDHEAAVEYFAEGMNGSEEEISLDSRMYTTWGESLLRLDRIEEARKVFKRGAALNLYPSEHQRSLYNVNGLEAKPFWPLAQTGLEEQLIQFQSNWELVRDEVQLLLNSAGHFSDEEEQLLDVGDWKQLVLYSQGRKMEDNCELTPLTCSLIDKYLPEARDCSRGQIKFSVLDPGTHIWPHCGPTNTRLRAHLTLDAERERSFLRVVDEEQSWREGQWIVFDDSHEHEVWHRGTRPRLVLIVDFWHPGVNAYQREYLPPI